MNGSEASPARRRGGLELLRKVYDELYVQLGDEFSPAELLRAAQTLIDVTKEEYGLESYQDGQIHPGYYSFEVDHMIARRQWWLLGIEAMAIDAQEESFTTAREDTHNLKRFYNPDPYYPRG